MVGTGLASLGSNPLVTVPHFGTLGKNGVTWQSI